MEFKELILKRRSVRDYQDKKIPQQLLIDIINDCTYAPSSGNEQPWKFRVANDKVLMKKLSDEAKETLIKRISSDPNDYANKYKKLLCSENYNIFYNAPALVFVIGENNLKNTTINCTLAASYFMLSAAVRGLGTCWINFATFIESEDTLKKLNIPKNYDIIAPIIVGYPKTIPQAPKRKELDIITIEKHS